MKNRYIWMVLGGFLIAFCLFFLVQLASLTKAGQFPGLGNGANEAPVASKPNKVGVRPVTFENISEFVSGNSRKMRLIGRADPNSVVMLLNRGQRLRQIKSNVDGDWGVTLDIDAQAMAIEALMFTGGDEVSIRSDEIIFRIPVPQKDGIASANYTGSALLMIGNSGGPSRIIQSPFGQLPTTGSISLGAIDYDDAGGVIFSGSTSAQGRVRIYLGEAAIGETGVQSDGSWNFTAGKMLPLGEYDVWAEFMRPNQPNERIGLVFERLPPLPQAANDEGSLSVKFEPFNWQIRRSLVGGGSQSTVVFDPQGQIDTPDQTELKEQFATENPTGIDDTAP